MITIDNISFHLANASQPDMVEGKKKNESITKVQNERIMMVH